MSKLKKELKAYFDVIKPEFVMEQKEEQDSLCSVCKCELRQSSAGHYSCSNRKCGIMADALLDRTPEWRYGNNAGPNPTRCGMPINPLLQESSYGLKVLTTSGSSFQMRKIGRYTSWIGMPYKEKAHYDEFQRISLLANQGGLPKIIIADAMRFHKMISERKTFRGLNRDGIIAASVYISSRVNGFPRTPKEIARIFVLNPTATTRGCKNAMSIFNEIEQETQTEAKVQFCLSTPESFLPRYCSRLGLNDELLTLCLFIAHRVKELGLVPENTPHAKAAGIIFLVSSNCNLHVSKTMISAITEISEVTINKCFRKLMTNKEMLLPTAIIQKYS